MFIHATPFRKTITYRFRAGQATHWSVTDNTDTIVRMNVSRAVLIGLLGLNACTSGNPENSPVCGFASMAGALMVLEQIGPWEKVLQELPEEVEGVVPARVVGHGTKRALAGRGADGAILGYEGDGFPQIPGFGLVLVEDSLETFKGVLIFDTEPPKGFPHLGTISDQTSTLPLYGLRVTWGAVSNSRCPMFGPIDSILG